ncbi:MAG: SpoIIE family protein phosphatase [Desulfofustis sp.]|nr:SpoIIE family protein phosphatase [Desulfofustis sp.]
MKKSGDKSTLKDQLKKAEIRIRNLERKVEEANRELSQKTDLYQQTMEELSLAKLIINQSPVVLFRRKAGLTGTKPTLEYVSENLKQFGYDPRDFLEEKIRFAEIVHQEDIERLRDEINEYAEADVEEYTQYYRVLTKDGEERWVEDQTSVVRDNQGNKIHNQGILIDITERRRAEEKLKKSEEKFRRIVETAGEGFVLMDEELKIVDVNNAYCRMIGFSREELIGRHVLDLATDQFRSFMLANKEKYLAREQRNLEGELVSKEDRIIPVLIHGSTLRDDHGKAIGNMAFVTDMTEHKKALMLAGEVQKSMLPTEMPDVRGLDIAGRNVSCDEIGGDYYDFIWRPDSAKKIFSIVVGDISGHGVDSALLMTTARAFLRMRASQPGSISEIVTAMNDHLAQDTIDTGKFMTLFCLTIDPEGQFLEWVRAGHDPALVYSPQMDTFEELKGSGIALGVTDGFQYTENRKTGLQNGQVIAIGTDGIWEAFNTGGEMFGKERYQKIIRDNCQKSAAEILDAVYRELNEFTFGKKSEDDITLVIVKLNYP